MGLGRWLRNKTGFAVSEWAILQRWDDIGGPKPFEKWSLQSKQHFYVVRLANAAMVPLGVLLSALLFPIPGRQVGFMMVGTLIGAGAAALLSLERLWDRHNALYQRWLREQAQKKVRKTSA